MNTSKTPENEDIVPEMSKARGLLHDQKELVESIVSKILSIASKCNNISPLNFNLAMDETRPDNLIEGLKITNNNLIHIETALMEIDEHLLKTIG